MYLVGQNRLGGVAVVVGITAELLGEIRPVVLAQFSECLAGFGVLLVDHEALS